MCVKNNLIDRPLFTLWPSVLFAMPHMPFLVAAKFFKITDACLSAMPLIRGPQLVSDRDQCACFDAALLNLVREEVSNAHREFRDLIGKEQVNSRDPIQ
jgi:hypothetical protein